ncbi:MAG: hypothetical protein A2161_09210, partial [Candidatus Schekmanbacteria bacterium RBG_13_48_7]
MRIARVVGNIAATIKHDHYRGHKIMLVQPVDEGGNNAGDSFVAVDFVQAGIGDFVLVIKEGGASRMVFGYEDSPVHAVIVGFIDEIQTGKRGSIVKLI